MTVIVVSVVLAVALLGWADIAGRAAADRERIRVDGELELARIKRLDEEQKAAVLAEVAKLRLEHEQLASKVAGLRTSKAFGGS